MAERTPAVGDNWRLRYDGLKFHVPTSLCDMPYLAYPKELQTPHLLTKNDLADQVERYVNEFNLNIINSAKIINTEYNKTKEQWTVRFTTPQHGKRTAIAKHLVLATGVGSQKSNMPALPGRESYKGVVMHSNEFKNGQLLKKQGIKVSTSLLIYCQHHTLLSETATLTFDFISASVCPGSWFRKHSL